MNDRIKSGMNNEMCENRTPYFAGSFFKYVPNPNPRPYIIHKLKHI